MKIINFGSLNYDYVYSVKSILIPGETQASLRMETFCGGKGLNQSVALAKAGAGVWHAGMVGEDGGALLSLCEENGVDVSLVKTIPGKSGHTVIQVDEHGQNCILLYGGANRSVTQEYADGVFAGFSAGDMLLLQNEVNGVDRLIDAAYRKGMQIALNPSPFDDALKGCDLSKVAYLLLNEIEAFQFSGERQPDAILGFFAREYPQMTVVLTLGKAGAVCQREGRRVRYGIYSVPVVDTTAAGDTFTGYFLAAVLQGRPLETAVELASKASSIAVSRKGAAPSIPSLRETLEFPFDRYELR